MFFTQMTKSQYFSHSHHPIPQPYTFSFIYKTIYINIPKIIMVIIIINKFIVLLFSSILPLLSLYHVFLHFSSKKPNKRNISFGKTFVYQKKKKKHLPFSNNCKCFMYFSCVIHTKRKRKE